MAPHSRPQSTTSSDDDEPASPRTLLLGDYKLARSGNTGITSIQETGKDEAVAAQRQWARTYVLSVIVMLSLLQSMAWNFYTPINETVQVLYGFDNFELSWVANTANIAMLVSIPASSLAVEGFGPRGPTIGCAAAMALCTALRLIPQLYNKFSGDEMEKRTILVVNIASMVCNGASAAWLNFAGPVLSEIWYGAEERAVVTAIISVAPYVGVSLGFVIGPLIIPSGAAGEENLNSLLWVHAVIGAALLVMTVLYFPNGPARPPSQSQANRAEHSTEGSAVGKMCAVLGGCGDRPTGTLWVVAVVFSIPIGVYSGWGAVLAINLKNAAGISAIAAGWVGCGMTLSGCFLGLLLGRLNDTFPGNIKKWIVICNGLASVCFGLFCLRVLGFLTPTSIALDNALLYGCSVAGGMFLNGPLPLYFELAVEQGYPAISGNLASMVLTLLITVVQIVFLAVSFMPGAGGSSRWMDWAMLVVTPVCTLPLIFMRSDYNRLLVDNPALKMSRFDQWGW